MHDTAFGPLRTDVSESGMHRILLLVVSLNQESDKHAPKKDKVLVPHTIGGISAMLCNGGRPGQDLHAAP